MDFEHWELAQELGLGAFKLGGLLHKWPAFTERAQCTRHELKSYMCQQQLICLCNNTLEVSMMITQFIVEDIEAQRA